jgi:O-antigen/teichoic acid export membrane protein
MGPVQHLRARPMHIHKSVVVNFAAGLWLGLLIVATTPWYVADLGLEGFALVGIWQLLFYIALVFDFGFGAACARELARGTGAGADGPRQRATFLLFERPVVGVALVMLMSMALAAPWLAGSWLDVRGYTQHEVSNAMRMMAAAVALQFVTAFQFNALAGLQRMGTMNLVQTAYNTARYLGGAAVLALSEGIVAFFAFQALAAAAGLAIARVQVMRSLGASEGRPTEALSLREHAGFSGGMFLTAAAGALLANADRIAVSRMLSAETLGKYTVALTAIGLLQTLVFAFHRAYYPRFAELSAAGNPERLKAAYRDACDLVGAVLVPVALFCMVFTPELYRVWLGHAAEDTLLVSRLLLAGFVLSGVMWLPAAYQQAIGWTRLHVGLMSSALLLGLPLLLICVHRFGLVGAASLMLLHGLLQITVGIGLMNRACFPGETARWYASVLGRPLLASVPVLVLAAATWPSSPGRIASAAWLLAVCAVLGFTSWFAYLRRARGA